MKMKFKVKCLNCECVMEFATEKYQPLLSTDDIQTPQYKCQNCGQIMSENATRRFTHYMMGSKNLNPTLEADASSGDISGFLLLSL